METQTKKISVNGKTLEQSYLGQVLWLDLKRHQIEHNRNDQNAYNNITKLEIKELKQ